MPSFTGLVTWTHYLSLIRFCLLICKMGIAAVSSLRGWNGIIYEKHLINRQAWSECYSWLSLGGHKAQQQRARAPNPGAWALVQGTTCCLWKFKLIP